jgi:hypothetical protein
VAIAKRNLPPVVGVPAVEVVPAGAAEVLAGAAAAAAVLETGADVAGAAVDRGVAAAALCVGEAGVAGPLQAARTTPPKLAANAARAWRRLRRIGWTAVVGLDRSYMGILGFQ